jgi:putative transposase
MLAMTGRVTMLGLSRWTEQGGSYRTIQRFYNTTIVWLKVNWFFIRYHLLDPADTILIGGDETVVTKSGQKSYGLDRFFSSLYGKVVPGLSFFSLSLISLRIFRSSNPRVPQPRSTLPSTAYPNIPPYPVAAICIVALSM